MYIVGSFNSDTDDNHSIPVVDIASGDEKSRRPMGFLDRTPTLTYDDFTRILIVSTLRPAIRCQKTTSRACGYIIRPEIRLPRLEGRAAQYLESLGIEPREVYAKPEEINRVLSITKGMDEFVPDVDSIRLVRALNGRLKQPRTHDEVIDALQMIQDAISSEPS